MSLERDQLMLRACYALQAMIPWLAKGYDQKPCEANLGLCFNLEMLVSGMLDDHPAVWVPEYISEIAQSWPSFSGNPHYPVPSPKGLTPQKAYSFYSCKYRSNKYGALRIELLTWLIDTLEKQLCAIS